MYIYIWSLGALIILKCWGPGVPDSRTKYQGSIITSNCVMNIVQIIKLFSPYSLPMNFGYLIDKQKALQSSCSSY